MIEDDEYEYLFRGMRDVNKEIFEIEKMLLDDDDDIDFEKIEKRLKHLTNALSELKSYNEVEIALLKLEQKINL